MTLEFQTDVFKFILQSKEGRKYAELLTGYEFDLPELKFIFDLVRKYQERYRRIPSRVALIEYFDKATKQTTVDEAVYKKVESTIRELYTDYDTDEYIIKESVLDFARYKGMANVFKEYAGKLKDDPEAYKKVFREMTKIVNLSDTETDESKYRGGGILKDFTLSDMKGEEAHPHFLRGINNMTSYGGFYPPQLIIFMGAPKSFKTGTLIKTATEYVRHGYKVYYVDCENGIKSIRTRAYQSIMETTGRELREGDNPTVLRDLVERWQIQGGEMEFGFYPAYTKCVNDVKVELDWLKEEKNWEPDIICWDYPDLMLANDPTKRKEKRINIQHVYFDIINLNAERGLFSFGLSQVNKNAVNKAVINMKDFSEDFGKAMNSHAAFAICRTQEEQESGFARFVPVVQREGQMFTGHNQVVVRMEEKRMIIKEIDYDEALEYLDEEGFTTSPPKRERITKEDVKNSDLTDE